MQQTHTSDPTPPSSPNWKTPASLFAVLILCLGALWLTTLKGCGGDEKDHPPVRSTYYYQLVFHVRKMGPAVYQATGDQGKQTSAPLDRWLLHAQVLTRDLSQDKVASMPCRQAAAQTSAQLHSLAAQTKGSKAYTTGYKAWQQVNALLLKCE